MGKKHKPRDGSLQYYPRKRAKKQTAHFKRFKESQDCRLKNFLGYKVGMLQISGIDRREESVVANRDVVIPATVIEVPDLKIFGIRAYAKIPGGKRVLTEKWANNLDKNLARKLHIGKKKKDKGKAGEAEKKTENKKPVNFKDLFNDICEIRLLAHTQPALTSLPKKKPEIIELCLNGNIDDQLKFAEEKLGKAVSVDDAFKVKDYLDTKAVTKGKGTQGVVKRYGVKIHRPKSKYQRQIGSIGPWHPATVMFTVGRAGQMGYHTRTEFNKRILRVGNPPELDDFSFKRYGKVKNRFMLMQGSISGPSKRAIAFRKATRPLRDVRFEFDTVNLIAN